MKINNLKPTSSGSRHRITLFKNELSKTNILIKDKIKSIKNNSGKSSNTGHTTVWHKGGGSKKLHRILTTKKSAKFSINIATLNNPTTNNLITLAFDPLNFGFFYERNTNKTAIGALCEHSTTSNNLRYGCSQKLKDISAGSLIHSITNINHTKSLYTRAAGTSSQIVQKTKNCIKIKLPSGKIKTLNENSYATIGSVSNKNFSKCSLGKAGKSRHIGKRPTVRGIAMNPVDHPHGGRTCGGKPSVTPWGKLTRGVPTRKKNK